MYASAREEPLSATTAVILTASKGDMLTPRDLYLCICDKCISVDQLIS